MSDAEHQSDMRIQAQLSRTLPVLSSVLLAAIFVVSAGDKAMHISRFEHVLQLQALVPGSLVPAVAIAVTLLEFLVGFGLLIRPLRSYALGAVMVATVVFLVVLVSVPSSAECGCGGILGGASISLRIKQDVMMLIVAACTLYMLRHHHMHTQP